MDAGTLAQTIELTGRLKRMFVATAAPDGTPHLTSAKSTTVDEDGLLHVAQWFCPKTLENLQANGRVSVIVWDPERDVGIQLVGEVQDRRQIAVLDGVMTEEEQAPSSPSAEQELLVRVDEATEFSQSPHMDEAELESEESRPSEGGPPS
jgi:hypothetical protein